MRPDGDFPHGDDWEKWVNMLLITRYGDGGYQPIPAKDRGDAGLEGFATSVGHAYQSYSPYQSYSTNERVNGIKRKIRDDVNKLIKNHVHIKALIGKKRIHKWILVVPKMESKECIKQAKKYEGIILNKGLDYISDSFQIFIHDEDSYQPEISIIIKSTNGYIAIDNDHYAIDDLKNLEDDSVSVANLARKCRLVYGKDVSSIKVSEHLKNAARKKNILATLRRIPTQYEQAFKIKKSQEAKHLLFANKSKGHDELLYARLQDLESDFKAVPALDVASARTVCMGTLAEWLMDCHIDFE